MKKQCRTNGKESFDAYYSEVFGERWEPLKKALLAENKQTAFSDSLKKTYWMDSGSYIAAMNLPLDGAKTIADMCAAPGGKSLVIATHMDKDAVLVSNERSRDRKARLQCVLQEHLAEDVYSRIRVTGYDAGRWCQYEKEAYDRILLDVPCSSERHVMADPKYLDLWSPARIRNLSATQWSILSSALLVLKKGGYLLYSTCALTDKENDGIIDRAVKKYDNVSVVSIDEKQYSAICSGEKTKNGVIVLPDVQDGAGPLYFSLLFKSF
ncbi:MAG: hypothetical protein J6T84_08780 [Spirochaetaceae bacterium]|nr:hypothetical protein [Spirochaetaceae bacterium]